MHIVSVDDTATTDELIYLECEPPMTSEIAEMIESRHPNSLGAIMGRLTLPRESYLKLGAAAHQSGQDLSYHFNGWIQEAEELVQEKRNAKDRLRYTMLKGIAKSFGVPLRSEMISPQPSTGAS